MTRRRLAGYGMSNSTSRRLHAVLTGLTQGAAAGDVDVLESEAVDIMLPPRHTSRQSSIQIRRATVDDIPSLRAVTHCALTAVIVSPP